MNIRSFGFWVGLVGIVLTLVQVLAMVDPSLEERLWTLSQILLVLLWAFTWSRRTQYSAVILVVFQYLTTALWIGGIYGIRAGGENVLSHLGWGLYLSAIASTVWLVGALLTWRACLFAVDGKRSHRE